MKDFLDTEVVKIVFYAKEIRNILLLINGKVNNSFIIDINEKKY